jgi:hypothetical protein
VGLLVLQFPWLGISIQRFAFSHCICLLIAHVVVARKANRGELLLLPDLII